MALIKCHVKKQQGRSTISLERVLAELLSLHLCGRVNMSVVRNWCQEQIDEDPGAYLSSASQRLASRAALAIAPKALQQKYEDKMLAVARAGRGRKVKRKR